MPDYAAKSFDCDLPYYTAELERFEDSLEAALSEDDSVMISTEHITGASLLDHNFVEMYQGGRLSIRAVFEFLRRLHSSYELGEPLPIPVIDQTPYGLGIEIQVPKEFEECDFEEMVESIWPEAIGYSLSDNKNRFSRAIYEKGFVRGFLSGINGMAIQSCLKLYSLIFLPNLNKSYESEKNNIGIRFLTGDSKNYINISGGVKSYNTTVNAARKITDYMDY